MTYILKNKQEFVKEMALDCRQWMCVAQYSNYPGHTLMCFAKTYLPELFDWCTPNQLVKGLNDFSMIEIDLAARRFDDAYKLNDGIKFEGALESLREAIWIQLRDFYNIMVYTGVEDCHA